jgi:hypothetical protein
VNRANYSDDCEFWDIARWRGAAKASIRGRRGQAFLRELLAALDTMSARRLINSAFERDGDVCALGAVAKARKVTLEQAWADEGETEKIAGALGIAYALAQEIMCENDSGGSWNETPERRFARVRKWVIEQIVEPSA